MEIYEAKGDFLAHSLLLQAYSKKFLQLMLKQLSDSMSLHREEINSSQLNLFFVGADSVSPPNRRSQAPLTVSNNHSLLQLLQPLTYHVILIGSFRLRYFGTGIQQPAIF